MIRLKRVYEPPSTDDGFRIIGEDRGFANARGKEIEDFLLQLH